MGYKSRPHLPRGQEGTARQAAQKEAALAKKKKKTKKARRRFEKEKEISRRIQGGESWSNVEVKLESEESMKMGGDASASEDKGDRGAIVTSVEHCEPMAASVGSGRDMETRDDVPESRKHAASEDTTVE